MKNTHTSKLLPILMLSTLCLVSSCASLFERVELSRVTAPSGRYDAVFARDGGGGATVGYSYYLYIVPEGEPVGSDEILWAEKVGSIELHWNMNVLEVRYDSAMIYGFRNFWYLPGDPGGPNVEIRLVATDSWGLD